MKIKIAESNKAKLVAALSKANGRARTRMVNYDDLLGFVAAADEHMKKYRIPKSAASGCQYLYRESVNCNSYGAHAEATAIEIEHGSSDWFLIATWRADTNTSRGSRSSWFTPTEEAISAATRSFLKGVKYPE